MKPLTDETLSGLFAVVIAGNTAILKVLRESGLPASKKSRAWADSLIEAGDDVVRNLRRDFKEGHK